MAAEASGARRPRRPTTGIEGGELIDMVRIGYGSGDEIRWRLQRGDLIRVHRGVYRVGHWAPSTDATYLAAVFAAGEGALLCGRAAAHLLRIIKGQAPAPEVIARTQRRIEGVTTHRSRAAGDARDATVLRGIPITTVPRTLVDISSVLSLDALARACHEAGVLYGATPNSVEAVLARRPNNPGAKKLRRVIHGDIQVTLSKLESRF